LIKKGVLFNQQEVLFDREGMLLISKRVLMTSNEFSLNTKQVLINKKGMLLINEEALIIKKRVLLNRKETLFDKEAVLPRFSLHANDYF
jgi:hypothetical protein